jgi:hypothetical protein
MSKPKSYVRSSDRATMVEVEPHQYVTPRCSRRRAAIQAARNAARRPRLRAGDQAPDLQKPVMRAGSDRPFLLVRSERPCVMGRVRTLPMEKALRNRCSQLDDRRPWSCISRDRQA